MPLRSSETEIALLAILRSYTKIEEWLQISVTEGRLIVMEYKKYKRDILSGKS